MSPAPAARGAVVTVNYEAEYNNRARVPEHPAIFARWERDAQAYREAAAGEGRSEVGIPYGGTPRQYFDLFRPAGAEPSPVAVFIHGGYWRSLDPRLFSHLARGLNAHGFTVALVGYDLCPQVGIADIIAQTRNACLMLWRGLGQRLLVYGHSAGGHLAACMLATEWNEIDAEVPSDLVPAAFAISGVFDLQPLVEVSTNQDLRLTAQAARHVSPIHWPVSPDRALDAVVGAEESSEFLRQSRSLVETWAKAGVPCNYQELPGNHFTVIDPLADPASSMVARVVALAERVRARQ
jgi:arylformamidase